MSVTTILAFVVGVLAGAAIGRLVKNKGAAVIRVRREVSAPPERIIELIAEVEQEPRMIPFVRSVSVMARKRDSVRYRVLFGYGGFAWAVYRKSTDVKKRRAEWRSERGFLGLSHTGSVSFSATSKGYMAVVHTQFEFGVPVVGPLLVLLAEWPVAGAMSAWLRNLDREA